MNCPRCRAQNPPVARFCFQCGQALVSTDLKRKDSYAAHPDEPVASFSIVTTIMPHGSGALPHTYRIALAIALLFPIVGAVIGALSFAIVTAAFAVPVVYIVYLYDVNLWEDEPVNVTVMAFLFTGILSFGFTLLWREWLFKDLQAPASLLSQTVRGKEVLVLCLLVPVVSAILMQVGPLFLASRPAFDDLMDGLTFGVISGLAYATFETLVRFRSVIVNSDGLVNSGNNVGLWLSIVVTAALIKPLVYGTATGIACAEFSGLGEGYDGFTPRYWRGLCEAVASIVIFNLGIYFFSLVRGTPGAMLGAVWGLVVAAVLILRVRTVLHTGLMEAAVEAAARGPGKYSTREIGFCPNCEMPLLDGSLFCISCGTSLRAVSKVARRQNTDAGHPRAVGGSPPSGPPGGVATQAPGETTTEGGA